MERRIADWSHHIHALEKARNSHKHQNVCIASSWTTVQEAMRSTSLNQIKRDVVDLVWSTVGRDHSVGEKVFVYQGLKAGKLFPKYDCRGGAICSHIREITCKRTKYEVLYSVPHMRWG
jgi:hypothetical protein